VSTPVRTEIDQGIATVTLRRPEARNALSPELVRALLDALGGLEREPSMRAMILAGAGAAFCAGMDLKFLLADPAGARLLLHDLGRAMQLIRALPFPTIARVQGAAVGGGCGLMVVCDFAITHPEARIGYPEVSLGLCPAVVAPWLMRRVGPGRARAMLLCGGTVAGREAFELGLATHLADQNRLEAESIELARNITAGGPTALATTKRWLNELDGSLEAELSERGADLSADIVSGEEAQERLRARFGTP
jgi:methylglutaconyl-CoA hydratase